MTGVDESGMRAVKSSGPGRFDKFSPSLDELTGMGPESDRDGAIIALALKCRWSPDRLATLFGITERRVQQIVAAFLAEFGEARS